METKTASGKPLSPQEAVALADAAYETQLPFEPLGRFWTEAPRKAPARLPSNARWAVHGVYAYRPIASVRECEALRQPDLVPTPPRPSQPHLRLVMISDTHGRHDALSMPDGDILLHSGDFTLTGERRHVEGFSAWLGRQSQFRHRIVIAGNHEKTFDREYFCKIWNKNRSRNDPTIDPAELSDQTKRALTNCTYLEDQAIEVEGLKIYGSPWQPQFHDWAFNLYTSEQAHKVFDAIPDDVDVLLTHGPPRGHGDWAKSGFFTGCPVLLNRIKACKPLVHVFGHIHEAAGVTYEGEHTVLVNACSVNFNYRPAHDPVVIDLVRVESPTTEAAASAAAAQT